MMRATWAKSCCRVTFAESSSTRQKRPVGIPSFPRRSIADIFQIFSTISLARPPILYRYHSPTCSPKSFPPYCEYMNVHENFDYRNHRGRRPVRVQSKN